MNDKEKVTIKTLYGVCENMNFYTEFKIFHNGTYRTSCRYSNFPDMFFERNIQGYKMIKSDVFELYY